MLDEIEEGLLAPVHVIEDERQWPYPCQMLEEAAYCGEALLGAGADLLEADDAGYLMSDALTARICREHPDQPRPGLVGRVGVTEALPPP
jgi:hypothetical protein